MYVLHGVHDWGSQVIHMALAELGENERAWELLNMINPINHA